MVLGWLHASRMDANLQQQERSPPYAVVCVWIKHVSCRAMHVRTLLMPNHSMHMSKPVPLPEGTS